MGKTKEGLPIVTMDAVHKAAAKIRENSYSNLLADITKENPLIAQAIERIVSNTPVLERERNIVKEDLISLYELLKCQGLLNQKDGGIN